MKQSLLASVRAAMQAGSHDAVCVEDETDATASSQDKETGMAKEQDTPRAATETGAITTEVHERAVSAARDEGRTEGARTATERFVAAMGAENVRGNAVRMAAALDLAVKSPAMTGEDVAAFVVANVAADKPATTASYDEERHAAATGLAQPAARTSPQAKTGWGKTADRINRRNS